MLVMGRRWFPVRVGGRLFRLALQSVRIGVQFGGEYVRFVLLWRQCAIVGCVWSVLRMIESSVMRDF